MNSFRLRQDRTLSRTPFENAVPRYFFGVPSSFDRGTNLFLFRKQDCSSQTSQKGARKRGTYLWLGYVLGNIVNIDKQKGAKSASGKPPTTNVVGHRFLMSTSAVS